MRNPFKRKPKLFFDRNDETIKYFKSLIKDLKKRKILIFCDPDKDTKRKGYGPLDMHEEIVVQFKYIRIL